MLALRRFKLTAVIRESKTLFVLTTVGLLSLLCTFTVPAQTANAASTPQNEIKIAVTAIDKSRKPVNTLRSEDFRLLEAGIPHSIAALNRIVGRNLSVAILIDTSLSQERTLGGLQFTAKSFLTSTIKPGRDLAAVATFAEAFTVEQKLTDDLRLLQIAIDRTQIHFPAGYIGGHIVVAPTPLPKGSSTHIGSTGIWDSIVATCEQVLSGSSREGGRAVVLMSDGNDTSSKRKFDDAVQAAVRANVAIYSIGIGDSNYFGVNKDALRKVSESTGGRAFFPKIVDELPPIFTEIQEALRNQYVLSYSQSPMGKPLRKLRIEIVNPALKGVQLFYQGIVHQTQP